MGEAKGLTTCDLGGVLLPRWTPLKPPESYVKKVLNPGGDCPLVETYTREQVERRIAFYRELNRKRDELPRGGPQVEKRLALYGWEDTTTLRVYMRETVMKITRELFRSSLGVSVDNVHADKDHGYVLISVRATAAEILSLVEYIRPGADFFVYDGEEAKYAAGNTAASEFIIAKVDDPVQPARYWRRSWSFIAAMEEVPGGYSGFPFASQ